MSSNKAPADRPARPERAGLRHRPCLTPDMVPLIRPARPDDVPVILSLIRGLAEYERLSHEVRATEARLRASLFPAAGAAPQAYCVLAEVDGAAAGFALYFSTTPPFSRSPGCISRTCSCGPSFAAGAWAGR